MPRQSITASQKASLRAYHKSNPSLDNKSLRQWFSQTYHQSISQSSVSEILSSRYEYLDHIAQEKHLQNSKRCRSERWPLLEAALRQWLIGRGDQTPITTDLLREKARYLFQGIAEYRGIRVPKFSNRWIEGFRARHQTALSHGSEESDRADYGTQIREALSVYRLQDQYFCAETSLYWKMLPESALTKVPLYRLEKNRTRLSALLCTNLDGSCRLPPWYIGRHPNPPAFHSGGVDIKDFDIIWKHNRAAKISTSIFSEFLHWFDSHLGEKKAILWLDAFSARQVNFLIPKTISQLSQSLGLKSVTVTMVPRSHTDIHLHLTQEITSIWKTFYRRYWIQHVLDQLSARRDPLTTMNVKKAVSWASRAWNVDIDPQNIQDCFDRSSWRDVPREGPFYEDARLTEAKQQLQSAVKTLEQSSFIHEAMEINTFINLPFENSENSWVEEGQIASEHEVDFIEIPEGDSDEELE